SFDREKRVTSTFTAMPKKTVVRVMRAILSSWAGLWSSASVWAKAEDQRPKVESRIQEQQIAHEADAQGHAVGQAVPARAAPLGLLGGAERRGEHVADDLFHMVQVRAILPANHHHRKRDEATSDRADAEGIG